MRGSRWARCGLLIAVGLFALRRGPAAAQLVDQTPARPTAVERGARLSWVRTSGGDGCIDASTLSRDVRRRLRYNPFQGVVTQTIEGTVGREGDQWVAHLYNRDGVGRLVGARELRSEAESCRGLDAAVALAVALVIDPEAAMAAPPISDAPTGGEPSSAEPSSAEPSSAEPSSAQLAAPLPESRPAEDRPTAPRPRASTGGTEPHPAEGTRLPTAAVALGLVGAIDLVPGPAVGVSLTTDAAIVDPFRWRLGMLYVPETRTGGPAAEFGIGLTAVTLDACVVAFSAGPFQGVGCVGGAAGAMHAVVYAPTPADPGDRPWGALQGAFELGLEIAQVVWLSLALRATVPLVRWGFRVVGRETPEFQQPYVVPEAVFGVGVRFW